MGFDLTRNEILEKMAAAYRECFDAEPLTKEDAPLAACYHMYARSAKYVLTKKAELWSASSDEHVYIFSVPELTPEIYRECEALAHKQGMSLINPQPGHMSSFITAIFLCDSCTEEARRALKKCRIYKSFHFSLYGWMDFHTVLVDRQQELIDHNAGGRQTAKILKKILSKKKRRRIL